MAGVTKQTPGNLPTPEIASLALAMTTYPVAIARGARAPW